MGILSAAHKILLILSAFYAVAAGAEGERDNFSNDLTHFYFFARSI
jgi:hypothetical protein